ncbi:MAG: hypothetical protein IKA70_04865 [Alistipes sp.]|nr:hypothetical protein [Alistipes sp.]
MKHLFLLILVALMLGACGSKATKQQEQPQSEKRQLVGGYSEWKQITPQEMVIFKNATKRLDVKYKANKVAHQVVSGINLRFMCHSVLGEDRHVAFITIHVPPASDSVKQHEMPKIIEIKRMESFGRRLKKRE